MIIDADALKKLFLFIEMVMPVQRLCCNKAWNYTNRGNTIRIDHIAYRTRDRDKTAKFFIDAFGYRIQAEFEIFFNDEKTDKAMCIALEPPEKPVGGPVPWTLMCPESGAEMHLPPELFISSGSENSIVGKWVAKRDGIGGIHHIAMQVPSVEAKMKEWKDKGYAEFTSDKPMTCPGLTQVFTRPSELTNIIYEFIEREGHGFCASSVKQLMESTKEDVTAMKAKLDGNMM